MITQALSNRLQASVCSLTRFILLALCLCSVSNAKASAVEHGLNPQTLHSPQTVVTTVHPIDDIVRIQDAKENLRVDFHQMITAVLKSDIVFLGETHLDESTHLFEAAVLEEMAKRTEGKVVLSLEMFEQDVQIHVDDYLSGKIDERRFLADARPWGNYASGYRRLIEIAKKRGFPVIAANTPTPVRRKLRGDRQKAFDNLSAEDRALLPDKIYPAQAAYWERMARLSRGNGPLKKPSTPDENRLHAQNIWDNSMGDAAARALSQHPGYKVLHIAGAFHVDFGQGTVHQFKIRKPDASVSIITVRPRSDFTQRPEKEALARGDAIRADFVVDALMRARGRYGGSHAIILPSELRFHLIVPPGSAPSESLPLLVWLHDSGESVLDAKAYWEAALGTEARIAVVEGPHRRRDLDQSRVEDWIEVGHFYEGHEWLTLGLERLVDFVRRHYTVVPDCIVVAGEGAGGVVTTWTALGSEGLDASFMSFDTRPLKALNRLSIPAHLPAARGMIFLAQDYDEEAYRYLLADFKRAGVPTVQAGATPPGDFGMEEAIRSELGLKGLSKDKKMDLQNPLYLLTGHSAPRALKWARLQARYLATRGEAAVIVNPQTLSKILAEKVSGDRIRVFSLGVSLEGFQAHAERFDLVGVLEPEGLAPALPKAPGPYGGVTLLVLSDEISSEDAAAWRAIAETSPLKKKSRYARLIVTPEAGLATELQTLAAVGRRSVLVVPARFYAGKKVMDRLSVQAEGYASVLDLYWLPGLGGARILGEHSGE